MRHKVRNFLTLDKHLLKEFNNKGSYVKHIYRKYLYGFIIIVKTNNFIENKIFTSHVAYY